MKLKVKKKSNAPEGVLNNPKPKFNDLREVMDISRDFSMFYSGVEYEVYLRGCYDMGVRNFLMSYHYLKGRPLKSVVEQFDDKVHFFIDSGAYTYINDPKFENFKDSDWEKHIKGYLSWAERNKEYIFAIASLDIETFVGADKVKEWNRKFFEPFMLRTGIPVCFVWHEDCQYHSWEQHCKRYPYVGISAVNSERTLELNDFNSFLRIAEKYNSLVHGMGMTKTSMLPHLPFYTVDSTSWKVGMRYGLTSVWTGKKIQQFKKEEFDSKAVPFLNSYPNIKFDLDKLREFYEPEVIRANVYAYMRAEDFIKDRLKSLTYWKKAKAIKNDLDNLPPDFFPANSWFTSSPSEGEIKDYCNKMNINPDISESLTFIQDMTLFLNWDNDEYSSIRERYEANDGKILRELHDVFINKIRENITDIIDDLINFYKENLEGKIDTLLLYGTNFDRKQKEREEYLEDDEEYEYVDIPQAEVKRRLQSLLPSPKDFEDGAPEIDALDEEIYAKADITPVFDEKGHFVKGQQKVRKPKQVYSKKFPKLACDNCFSAAKCPEYKAGYVCAYSKIFKKFDTRNMVDIIESIQGIVSYNMERMQKAMIFETLNGSLDGNVSALMDTNIRYMQMLQNMYNNASQEVIRQTKVVRADGSMESTTQVSNPQSGGILEKLFSFGAEEKKEPKEEVIDAEAIEQK